MFPTSNYVFTGFHILILDVLEFPIPDRIIRQISGVIISANTVNICSQLGTSRRTPFCVSRPTVSVNRVHH